MKFITLVVVMVVFGSIWFSIPSQQANAAGSACGSMGVGATTAPVGGSGSLTYILDAGDVIYYTIDWVGGAAINAITLTVGPTTLASTTTHPKSGSFSAPAAASYTFTLNNPIGAGVSSADLNITCVPAGPAAPEQYDPRIKVGDLIIDSNDDCISVFDPHDSEAYCSLGDAVPEENKLILAFGKSRLYHLSTGEWQINVGPDVEGKERVIVFLVKPLRLIKKYEFNLYHLQ